MSETFNPTEELPKLIEGFARAKAAIKSAEAVIDSMKPKLQAMLGYDGFRTLDREIEKTFQTCSDCGRLEEVDDLSEGLCGRCDEKRLVKLGVIAPKAEVA